MRWIHKIIHWLHGPYRRRRRCRYGAYMSQRRMRDEGEGEGEDDE